MATESRNLQSGFDDAPLLVAVGLYGCGAKKQVHTEIVVPRPCIVAVELTPDTD